MKDRKAEHGFSRDTVRSVASSPAAPAQEKAKLSPIAHAIASQYARNTNSPVMISGIMRMIEFAIITLAGLAVFIFYVGTPANSLLHYTAAILATATLSVLLLEFADSYQLAVMRDPFHTIGRLFLSISGAFALTSLAGFFLKISEDFSRLWFGAWYIAALVAFIGFRIVMSRLIRRWARNGKMERRAVIVGGGKPA